MVTDRKDRWAGLGHTGNGASHNPAKVRCRGAQAKAGHVARAAGVRALERSIAAAEEQLPHPAPGRRAGSPRGTPSGTAPTRWGFAGGPVADNDTAALVAAIREVWSI
ncbi:hypothetical protein ACFQZK_01350 [Rhodococcus aetherivorans]